MKVQALVSFTYKDNVLSMYAGEIADVDSTIGADLISEGYVKEYSEGGGSDYSTASVTFIKDTSYEFDVALPIIDDNYLYCDTSSGWIEGDKTVVLYNNICEGRILPQTPNTITVTATGDIQADGTVLTITGDGTVTISNV